MRDAQIESIKTYLFLKIECKNRPLWELFASGKFNSLSQNEIDALEISLNTRNVLQSNPAALALWEYAAIPDEKGNISSPKIIDAIKRTPNDIDYERVLKSLFFNVNYPDYLFSIPMGAGKTYLMAALIYLNLYLALAEPENELFAHNFILFVPSGLKSSIIPSLRDIQNFNPVWILPDPVASQLKNLIQFEWLQESSSASKSNIVKNPNARKISTHTSKPNLMGLVAVTNAEKVILDRVDRNLDIDKTLLKSLSETERKEYEAVLQANELREHIGRIPGLCILIDEVHHASDDQKLRQVVNKWMEQRNFNSVLGFSGTPNMDPPANVNITADLSVRCTQYANVVTYYPLIKGLGNFLKIPTVRYTNMESSEILASGLREFFETYANTVYANGATTKIAVYAPSIAVLEEELYPEACTICRELNMNPSEVILKYHKGNSTYKVSEDAQFEFSTLDSPFSKIRIILLVGIGREGWNCKSLTGVILSQRNSCPQNMVLQISCRCLREVDNAATETALIWLNKFNAEKLNKQLQQQQYTTIEEFGSHKPEDMIALERYSRMDKLKLPAIDYYQIRIKYNTVERTACPNIHEYLVSYTPPRLDSAIIYSQGFDNTNVVSKSATDYGSIEFVNFRLWLDCIIKESFGTLKIHQLKEYESELSSLFERITKIENDIRYYSPEIDQRQVRANIRTCFTLKRTFNVSEELIPEEAELLNVQPLPTPIYASVKDIYVPSQDEVKRIVNADINPVTISEEERAMLLAMKARGVHVEIPQVQNPLFDHTYHYLPYHLDSTLEDDYFNQIVNHLKGGEFPNVEFYFNGDDTLTDFRIRCYAKRGNHWKMLGYYYPDFIMLTRNNDNTINKVIIIETKGEGFAGKFEPRKHFLKNMFVKFNNEKFGRERFHFLYIEDTLSREQRLHKTINKINSFLLN